MSQAESLIVTGPTASGKGALARELARRLGGEIVSVDSMKVYRELDVGTAKPTPEQRRSTVYHLIDIVEPHEEFSVGHYLPLMEEALEGIKARGRQAVLCGGSALYLKAFLEGLQMASGADWELRSRLRDEAAKLGPEKLHEDLSQLDPAAASKIQPTDLRRIVRAMEVRAKTGKPLSEGWSWGQGGTHRDVKGVFALRWPREELYRRIDRRVELMVEKGLFEETLRLSERQPPLSRSASQSIGYKEILTGIRSGLSHKEIVAQVQQSTRRFAKHQLTWFRRFPLDWIQASGEPDPVRLADEILTRLGD